MALPAARSRASYPLAAYNFRVDVGGTGMSFTEVSGLSVAHEHIVYRHGLSFAEGEIIETFASDRFSPVTCKRGAILAQSPLFLYDWLRSRDLRPMEISLCDETGTPALSWKIAAAVAVSLKAPSFNTSTNESVIDTLELQARGVSLVKH